MPRAGDPGDDFAALYRRLDEAERALAEGASASAERRRKVLAERARALAVAREAPAGEHEDVVAFVVAGERFGVPTAAVEQVLDLRELAPLPGAPPELAGMVVARSRVVPVLDPRPLLGLTGGGMSDLSRAIVLDREPSPFALAVETVEGRVEVPVGGSPAPVAGPYRKLAGGLALLDLDRLAAAIPRGR